ncbi:conserved hypothetical protein [Trichinella spiralis]|uniref:hypothetical protein n=1 Tax=Trichinella spiralis TaxID=6334 RepID=UPI0001EFCD76|nr:conserved hypothetical protein [Trichinella spiralis]
MMPHGNHLECPRCGCADQQPSGMLAQSNEQKSTSEPPAELFAAMLGYTDFTCTTGWLDKFDARHNICMYEDIDTAANTSDVPTKDDIVNDIHCDKQENSDTDTATAVNVEK